MKEIEKYFCIIWKVIQLTLIFHLLCILGLVIFGIGPAWQTIINLYLRTPVNEKQYSLKNAFNIWKATFWKSNAYFLIFLLLSLFLLYNLYLSLQFKGLFWFCLAVIIFCVWLALSAIFSYVAFYEVDYEISIYNNLKLSFISIFLNFKQLIILFISLLSTIMITWKFKGLFIFIIFGALAIILDYVTKPNRQLIDEGFDNDTY